MPVLHSEKEQQPQYALSVSLSDRFAVPLLSPSSSSPCFFSPHRLRIILMQDPALPLCQKVPPSRKGKKKKRDELIGEQVVSPPFPVPIRKQNVSSDDQEKPTVSSAVVWPLNQDRKQPFFLGKINRQDACIDILDPASVQCLYLLGFFGKGSLSKNAPIYKIKRRRELQLRSATGLLSQQQQQQRHGTTAHQLPTTSQPKAAAGANYARRSPVQTRYGPKKKQWNSLRQAFGGALPDKAGLIQSLFPRENHLNNNNSQQERSSFSSLPAAAEAGVEAGTSESDDAESTTSWESDVAMNAKSDGTAASLPADCSKGDRQEILKLGLDEAYFLSYGLGVLSIVPEESGDPFMNLDELWSTYRRLFHPDDLLLFPVIYAAYHYFRSRGWIVKCGLKFACDFLLYREGPPFNHSEFAVTVVRVRESDQQPLKPAIDWQHVTAMQRMSRGVRKKAILCHVIIGDDVTEEDFALVSVIEKLQVHCCQIERWTPRKDDTDECSE